MNAKEARKLAEGRDYSDYLVDEIKKGIRFRCGMGYSNYQYCGGGSTAFSPESGDRAAEKLRSDGYQVEVGHQLICVHW